MVVTAKHLEAEHVLCHLDLLPLHRLTIDMRWLVRDVAHGSALVYARNGKATGCKPAQKACFRSLKLVPLLLPLLKRAIKLIIREAYLVELEWLLLNEPHDELLLHGPLGSFELTPVLADGNVVLVVALLDALACLEPEVEGSDDAIVLDGCGELGEVFRVANLGRIAVDNEESTLVVAVGEGVAVVRVAKAPEE